MIRRPNTDGASANIIIWDANDIFIQSLYCHMHIELEQYPARRDCHVNNA